MPPCRNKGVRIGPLALHVVWCDTACHSFGSVAPQVLQQLRRSGALTGEGFQLRTWVLSAPLAGAPSRASPWHPCAGAALGGILLRQYPLRIMRVSTRTYIHP